MCASTDVFIYLSIHLDINRVKNKPKEISFGDQPHTIIIQIITMILIVKLLLSQFLSVIQNTNPTLPYLSPLPVEG